jgi:integrase
VYQYLCKLAVLTGLRFGELAALPWERVSLLDKKLRVSETYVDGIGLTTPKGGEPRDVYLTPQAVALLEAWFGLSVGERLVFQRDEGGHLRDG